MDADAPYSLLNLTLMDKMMLLFHRNLRYCYKYGAPVFIIQSSVKCVFFVLASFCFLKVGSFGHAIYS